MEKTTSKIYIVKRVQLAAARHDLEIGDEVEMLDQLEDGRVLVKHGLKQLELQGEDLQKKWVMPVWMEPLRSEINNTGGSTVEQLMNDVTTNFFNNHVRAFLIGAVSSQVQLLMTLHKKGIL